MITTNGVVITPTRFPDGTSQVWKLPVELLKAPEAHIIWNFENEGEFMSLAQLRILLSVHGIACHLSVPYLPYGRQDKAVSNDATFALLPFCVLLEAFKFATVTTIDVHSDIASQYYPGLINMHATPYIADAIAAVEADNICCPDKGALQRYGSKYIDDYHVSWGEKVRDQATGHITDYRLTGSVADETVLIVDDICDGGMTFILLAKALKEAGAKSVHLYVSHGIFSKGLGVLREAGIERIFTKEGEVK